MVRKQFLSFLLIFSLLFSCASALAEADDDDDWDDNVDDAWEMEHPLHLSLIHISEPTRPY